MPKPTKQDLITLRRHDHLMMMVEAPYMRSIVKEKNRYIQQVSDTFVNDDVDVALQDQHTLKMKEISSFYNNKTISIFAADVQSNAIKNNNLVLEVKQDLYDKWLNTTIAFWLAEHTAVQAVSIAATTTQDIKDAIEKSFEGGESRAETAKTILKVKGFSGFRADMIARTETHNAAMYASKESAIRLSREAGTELLKKWVPVQDSRTRDSHSAMAKHDLINMESLFNVGGERMDRPGDPKGSAKNVIHCRCTLTYKVPD